MNAPVTTRSIGDNAKRPALITEDQLAKDFEHLEQAVIAIETRAADAPPVLEDDEDLAIINKLVADCRDEVGKFDRAREAEKRPYLEAGRVVDAFFKSLTSRVERAKGSLEGIATAYLNKKAAEERRKRDEEARRLREEADRKAEEARKAAAAAAPSATPSIIPAMNEATQAQARAENAEAAAGAKPADLARTRTEGGTATLVDDWQFEITNYDEIDLNKLRPYFSRPDVEKAIRRHVGIHKDTQPVAGVRVFNKPKARMV